MAGDDEVWAELVETFHAPSDDEETTWPAAEDLDDQEPDPNEPGADSSITTTRPAWAGTPSMTHGGGPPGDPGESEAKPPDVSSGDDDHFVPPTPPPLPRTDLITALAWAGVLGTPVLFLLLVLLGQTLTGLAGLAAAGAFVGGFATLILRLRGHDPHDPDNGAVV